MFAAFVKADCFDHFHPLFRVFSLWLFVGKVGSSFVLSESKFGFVTVQWGLFAFILVINLLFPRLC